MTVRSLRGGPNNAPLEVKIPAAGISTTSALDIKMAVAAEAAAGGGGDIPLDKLRLLYRKKPVADSKSLKDLLGDEAATVTSIEFSVMVMGGGGGATAATKQASPAPAAGTATGEVAQGLSGEGVLETDDFWTDLQGYLQQRIRSEKVAEEACVKFRDAWAKRT